METLKIKVKKVIQEKIVEEQEKEIALPFYCKHKDCEIYFVVREDGSLVKAVNGSATGQGSLEYFPNNQYNAWMSEVADGIIITREEFYEQYNKAMSKIAELELHSEKTETL